MELSGVILPEQEVKYEKMLNKVSLNKRRCTSTEKEINS